MHPSPVKIKWSICQITTQKKTWSEEIAADCFIYFMFVLCLHAFVYRGTYSARRSVVSTCIRALMCTHVYMRCVYTRSTRPFRLHWASVRSPPFYFIYCVRVACLRCI